MFSLHRSIWTQAPQPLGALQHPVSDPLMHLASQNRLDLQYRCVELHIAASLAGWSLVKFALLNTISNALMQLSPNAPVRKLDFDSNLFRMQSLSDSEQSCASRHNGPGWGWHAFWLQVSQWQDRAKYRLQVAGCKVCDTVELLLRECCVYQRWFYVLAVDHTMVSCHGTASIEYLACISTALLRVLSIAVDYEGFWVSAIAHDLHLFSSFSITSL